MREDKEQREQERDAYSRNRTAEIFASKGFKKHLKDEGMLGGEKGKEIKKGIKAAKTGNTIGEHGAGLLDRAMQLYGKRSGAHNGRGEFDSNDKFSVMKKASKFKDDMVMDLIEKSKQSEPKAPPLRPEREHTGSKEYVYSDKVQAAKDRLEGNTYDHDIFNFSKGGASNAAPNSLFKTNNVQAPTNDVQTDSTGSYLDAYKRDLAAAGRLSESYANNITNAVKQVTGQLGY